MIFFGDNDLDSVSSIAIGFVRNCDDLEIDNRKKGECFNENDIEMYQKKLFYSTCCCPGH